MLRFDHEGPPVTPKDAATLILLRDGKSGLEVFCVQRHGKSAFMGGAIVFPGGKLDPADRDPAWAALTTTPREASFAPDLETARALAIAACRETLEEATLLPIAGAPLGHDELVTLRKRIAAGDLALGDWLASSHNRLDLARLLPLARWITPTAEPRRYDTRFFLAVAEATAQGLHDDHETTASFWATPADILARFARDTPDAIEVMPPTHRTLSLLARLTHASEAEAFAAASCKDPICPELVAHKDEHGETLALVLPGDPQHPVTTLRVPGPSRFVLRGARWLPEDAPGGSGL